MDGATAEVRSRDCSQSKTRGNDENFGTEAEKVARTERAGSVEEKVNTEETVPKFCLTFAKIARQAVTR